MAVLHLQFDVDSEVHPELHAMLSSIGSSLSQAERLRQLAATGLIWERLRLQAHGRMEVPDLGTESAAAREGSGSLPHLPAADSVRAVPRDDATTARRADLADFVDLSDTVDLTHLDIPGPNDADDGRSGHHVASHDVVSAENTDRAVQIAAAHWQPRGDMPEQLPVHEIRSVVQEPPVLNEVIGAQIVSVPTDVPIQRARAAFRNFMLALAGVFVFVGIVPNLMLLSMVVMPVSRLAKLADQVSMGKMDVPDFHVRSKDEIRMLADSFNRMKKSVVQAMKMLDE